MARIKDSKKGTQTHVLNKEELDYIIAVNETRNRRFEEDGRVLGAFLKYIAGSRLGYKAEDNLQFEIDFESEEKSLKVSIVE